MEHCFFVRWDICTSNEVYCTHWYEDFFQGYTVPKNPVKYEFPAIYSVFGPPLDKWPMLININQNPVIDLEYLSIQMNADHMILIPIMH